MERQFEHQIEWDPAKALRNAREHRVSFERAATVFLDPRALSIFDEEHSERAYKEEKIESILKHTGLKIIYKFDNYELKKVNEKTERIVYMVMIEGGNNCG